MNLQKQMQIKEAFTSYTGPTTSQVGQDIMALAVNGFKRNGFFIEFGALNGKLDSNTYVLEKEFGWNGILCEPGKSFEQELRANRNCIIDTRAVTNRTGDWLDFKETEVQFGLSGILEHFSKKDMHVQRRQESSGSIYKVNTISLNDLLDYHNAPAVIDFMSIDTEGSEPLILEAYNFSKRKIKFITVEHNYVEENRQRVKDVMFANGYIRIHHDISKLDDFFVLKD